MRRLGVVLAILSFAMDAAAQMKPNLSLVQAVQSALQANPLTRSAQLGMDLARTRVHEARTGHLPFLRLSQTVTRGNNPVFVFGSLLEQGRFGPENFSFAALNNPDPVTNVRTALSANLPLFDGFKTSLHIAEAKLRDDQSVFQNTAAEQHVRFDALRQYFAVVVAQQNRIVADEAVRMAESDLSRTKDRLEAGLAVESDRLAAQVQLSELTQQQIESEGNLATANIALNIAMGSPVEVLYNLTTGFSKRRFDVLRQEELIEQALRHRPDYLQASSAIDLAGRQISERKSDYLPELNAFGAFGNSGRNWSSGSTDYTIGAGISINLFDPGRGSRIHEAEIEHRLAEAERERVHDQIVVEVVRTYQQYRSAVQQLEVAEAAQAQAAEGLRIVQDRYEAGLTTITDLLRAETALVRSRLGVISAGQAVYVGYANVLLSIGELNDVRLFES